MKRRNRGETRGQRVNEEEEEKGAKDRALGNSTAKTEGRRERRNRTARAKRVGGSRRGRRTRDRAEKTISRARVRGRERRDSLLPSQSAEVFDGHSSSVVSLTVGRRWFFWDQGV